ncbi:uncharacterized protein RCO7_10355 [Rhynchosporium graminicola]|uniref:Hsp70 protein n=1 Tax=Rhynchosporium graminicola TaxID=2792576 RepID=A0A1E1KC04_9HELO|nr:uncharacterized protein RCO7_10355 [Rhynchosporium commune]
MSTTSDHGMSEDETHEHEPVVVETPIVDTPPEGTRIRQRRIPACLPPSTTPNVRKSPRIVSKASKSIPHLSGNQHVRTGYLQPKTRPHSRPISSKEELYRPKKLKTSSQGENITYRPRLRARPFISPRKDHEPRDLPTVASHTSAPPQPSAQNFSLGVDVGVTFTTVAYVTHNLNQKHPRIDPREVKYITNWPDDGIAGTRAQIPTEMWFSSVSVPPYDDGDSDGSKESDSGDNIVLDDRIKLNSAADCLSEFSAPNKRQASPGNEKISEHLWGYSVHQQRYLSSTDRDVMGHIDRPKLILVEASHTDSDRARLSPRLRHLIENGTIQSHGGGPEDILDVLIYILVKILGHTKRQLTEREGYTPDCPVSFALTVPTIWSARSSRILQNAFQAAIGLTDFGTLVNSSLENVFIVSEPEAAATFLLGYTHQMLPGETFTVLDCGGGTVDGSTYTVTSSYPLRLKSEVGQPCGDNCGASYLNDAFEKRLLKRLKDESYLDRDGETREDAVRYATMEFENRGKRNIDIAKRPVGEVRIPGLKGDLARRLQGQELKGFKPGFVSLDKDDYDEIFGPLLERTAAVLSKQLYGALHLGIELKKVFLIGGFGANPSLRSFLRSYLDKFVKTVKLDYDIDLHITNEQDSMTAIAAGATLRALNLDDGPKRRAVSSFGFLRREEWMPHAECYRNADKKIDDFDHLYYVSVIDYFLHKGEVVPPKRRYQPFKSTHSFELDEEQFLCEEILYVNDSDGTKSHYDVGHDINAGAQMVGTIITDMTYLRDEGLISPVIPQPDKDGIVRGKPHYEITFDLVPVVIARDMRYEARYPANNHSKVVQTGQISIAAAFEPGTG